MSGGVAAVLSFLLIVVISLIVVRVATVALTLTGLSKQFARFQARSAFTGAGFTTNEAERVTGHPVRRRIIMILMLLGNAGLVTSVATLITGFVGGGEGEGIFASAWFKVLLLFTGLGGLWIIAFSKTIDRAMSRIIRWALKRWTTLEVRDYEGLLHLSGDYAVSELLVEADDWLAGHDLEELKLAEEGVLVLGIEKADGTYLGAPRGGSEVDTGDTIIMYGPEQTLAEIDQRRKGKAGTLAHERAVAEQKQREAREEAAELEARAREARRPAGRRPTQAESHGDDTHAGKADQPAAELREPEAEQAAEESSR